MMARATTTTTVGSDGQLTITVRTQRRAVTVALSGELDSAVEYDVVDLLRTALALPKVSTMRVDLSGLSFIDSSGIRCLVLARQAAVERGSGFGVVVGSNRTVLRILDLTGMTDTLQEGLPEQIG